MENKFYVYVLLDPRKPGQYIYDEYSFEYEPFYVGKGKGKRYLYHFFNCVLEKDNNRYKCNKIKKIQDCGLNSIVARVADNLLEDDAFNLEIKLIQIIGRSNIRKGPLTNCTDGGEGMFGHIVSEETRQKMREQNVSEETRQKMSRVHKGKIVSAETKKKLSESHKGKIAWNKGIPCSEETKKKISEANKGQIVSEETRDKLRKTSSGRHHTIEARNKISEAQKGEKGNMFGKHHSDGARKKMSDARTGEKNHFYGKHHSEETCRKMREAWQKRKNSQ